MEAKMLNRKEGLIEARPGSRFAYRPTCTVEVVRGAYLGCSSYEWERVGVDITDSDFRLAHEVLLRYPTGEGIWHVGAWSREMIDIEAIPVAL